MDLENIGVGKKVREVKSLLRLVHGNYDKNIGKIKMVKGGFWFRCIGFLEEEIGIDLRIFMSFSLASWLLSNGVVTYKSRWQHGNINLHLEPTNGSSVSLINYQN